MNPTSTLLTHHSINTLLFSEGEGKGTRFTLELPMSRTNPIEINQSHLSQTVTDPPRRPSLAVSRTRRPFQYDAVAGLPEHPGSSGLLVAQSVPTALHALGLETKPDPPPADASTILRPFATSGDSNFEVVRRALSPALACGGGGDPTLSEGDNHPFSLCPPSSDVAFPRSNGRKGNLMLRELSRRDVLNPQSPSVNYNVVDGTRKKRAVCLQQSPLLSQNSPMLSLKGDHSPVVSLKVPDATTMQVVHNAGDSVALSVKLIQPEAPLIEEQNVHVVTPKKDTTHSFSSPKWVILVVDDSPLNRKMLMKTLRAAGHTCEEAGNGQEGVNMVQMRVDNGRAMYDVILMDFVMPVMNGPTATKVHNPYPQHRPS